MRKATNLILICCGLLGAAPREEYKRDFQRTFTLGGSKSFRLEHSLGNVNVRTHSGAELRVQATIRCSARTTDEARACTDRVQIYVDDGASGVTVRTVYPRNEGRNNISFGADYDVVMPATAPLDLRNRFGSVTVANLQAASQISNSNGKVSFSAGKGRQRVENSFGDVDIRGNDGEMTIRMGNGNVTASDITGALDITNRFGVTRVTNASRGLIIHSGNGNIDATNVGGVTSIGNTFGKVIVMQAKGDVTVENQNGSIQATDVTGIAILRTSFDRVTASRIGKALTARAQNGNVTVDTVGESATVEATFGNVDLRGVKGGARVTAGNSTVRLVNIGGEVYAKSTFGGITISDVAGPVTVENQNGLVAVDVRPGQRCQPVALTTSFAPIRLTIPAGGGYNVSARTSFGKIHSEHEITISGNVSPETMTGRIGAGGCEMRLMGQNGNIDILKTK